MQNFMIPLYRWLDAQRLRNEEGQTMMELALLIAFVSIALFFLVWAMASGVVNAALVVAGDFVEANMAGGGS